MEEMLVLLESANTAVNSIMCSMEWQPGDIIVHFYVVYGMVKSTAVWLQETKNIEIVVVPVQFPIHAEVESRAFMDPLERALETLKEESKIDRLKTFVLDHISSAPEIKEPVVECTAWIKAYHDKAFALLEMLPMQCIKSDHLICQTWVTLMHICPMDTTGSILSKVPRFWGEKNSHVQSLPRTDHHFEFQSADGEFISQQICIHVYP
jgi:hypothetical protein